MTITPITGTPFFRAPNARNRDHRIIGFAIETVQDTEERLGYPHLFYPALNRDDATLQIGKLPNLAEARIIEVNRFDWQRIMDSFF